MPHAVRPSQARSVRPKSPEAWPSVAPAFCIACHHCSACAEEVARYDKVIICCTPATKHHCTQARLFETLQPAARMRHELSDMFLLMCCYVADAYVAQVLLAHACARLAVLRVMLVDLHLRDAHLPHWPCRTGRPQRSRYGLSSSARAHAAVPCSSLLR